MRTISLLLLLIATATVHAQVSGEMIKDIVFKTEKELTAKYGKPVKIAESPEEDILGYGNYSLEWTISGQRVIAFYKDKDFKVLDGVGIYNFKYNPDVTFKQLQWDKPTIVAEGDNLNFNGLSGLRAWIIKNDKLLMIKPDNPKPLTFGKKK